MISPFRRRKQDKEQELKRERKEAPPGTLVADPEAPPTKIRVYCFGPDSVVESEVEEIASLPGMVGKCPVLWIQVEGLGDAETIRELGRLFELHDLALEDVVSGNQRPKAEEYEDHYYIVVREANKDNGRSGTSQVSLFLGKGFVITFRQGPAEAWRQIYDRISREMGRIRLGGVDYLAYSLLDASLDTFYPAIESIGEVIEALEDEIMGQQEQGAMARIHRIKRNLLEVRRAIWPFREAINTLQRDEEDIITEETRRYLRDLADHTFQLVDLVEAYREITSGLMEVYLIGVGNRTNEVMRVLTIISTLFIPLTFIAGLYGMNFLPEASPWNMPELASPYGYPVVLAVMGITAIVLLYFFWRKGWIGVSRQFWGLGRSKQHRRRGSDRAGSARGAG